MAVIDQFELCPAVQLSYSLQIGLIVELGNKQWRITIDSAIFPLLEMAVAEIFRCHETVKYFSDLRIVRHSVITCSKSIGIYRRQQNKQEQWNSINMRNSHKQRLVWEIDNNQLLFTCIMKNIHIHSL